VPPQDKDKDKEKSKSKEKEKEKENDNGDIYILARGLFAVAGIQVQNVVEYVDTDNLRTFADLTLHVQHLKRSKE